MQVLEQGLFRRVPMAGMLALHVWPGLAQGQLGIRSGAILSAVDSFEITVTGRGGHGSAPERACNPIPAGAALASAITAPVSYTHLDVYKRQVLQQDHVRQIWPRGPEDLDRARRMQ